MIGLTVFKYITKSLNFKRFSSKIRKPLNQLGDPEFLNPLPSFYDGIAGNTDGNICRLSIPDTQTEIKAGHVTMKDVVAEHTYRRNKIQESYGFFHESENPMISEDSSKLGFGIVATVKDLAPFIRGPHTKGSSLLIDNLQQTGHRIGDLLQNSGVAIIGRNSCSEFGIAPSGNNSIVGVVRNPFSPKLTTGGSSGGSAGAVASMVGHVSIGNDTGGSIRIPASFCGCVGIRPQRSLAFNGEGNQQFGVNLSASGPITRDVTDAAIVLDILASPPSDTHILRNTCAQLQDSDVQSLRIGFLPRTRWFNVDPRVEKAVNMAIARIKQSSPISIIEFDAKKNSKNEPFYPRKSPAEDCKIWWLKKATYTVKYEIEAIEKHNKRVLATCNKQYKLQDPSIERLSNELRIIMNEDKYYTADDFKTAFSNLQSVNLTLSDFMKSNRLDALITPTVGVLPWGVDKVVPEICLDGSTDKFHVGWNAFTYPINFANLASGTLNCGWGNDNDTSLPVGLQVIASDSGKEFTNLQNLIKIMKHLETKLLSQTTERGFPRFSI